MTNAAPMPGVLGHTVKKMAPSASSTSMTIQMLVVSLRMCEASA